MIVLDPKNPEIIRILRIHNARWENFYNQLAERRKECHFDIPKNEIEKHRRGIRHLITSGTELFLLNQHLGRKPKAQTHWQETAGHQLTGLKALKIMESAYSADTD